MVFKMEDQDRKKIIIMLRWTAIIVTSYLILFGKGRMTDLYLSYLLIFVYLLSNVSLSFFPKRWFSNLKLFYPLVLFDTGIVSFGMYLSEKIVTDFYIVPTLTREKRQELTISEDKYRGLFENANEGIILLRNHQLQIADVNREVEKVTGYIKGELIQKEVFDLFPPEEMEKARDFFKEVAETGEGRTDSLSLTKKDGFSTEVDLSTKKLVLEDEPFYQMIFRDLTEQRKLEKKIRQSKRNLEAIFDGIRDKLSIQAPDYQILRGNRAVVENYRTTFNDLIGNKCYEAYYQRTLPCENCPVSVTIQSQQPSFSVMNIPE